MQSIGAEGSHAFNVEQMIPVLFLSANPNQAVEPTANSLSSFIPRLAFPEQLQPLESTKFINTAVRGQNEGTHSISLLQTFSGVLRSSQVLILLQ